MTTSTETRSSAPLTAPTTKGIPSLPHIPENWGIKLTPEQQRENLKHVALWIVGRDLENFNMFSYHLNGDYTNYWEGINPRNCGEIHCIGGFAQVMCGELGFTVHPRIAGNRLLGEEAESHFSDTTEDGLAFLREVIARG
jgi:hypothetical protein